MILSILRFNPQSKTTISCELFNLYFNMSDQTLALRNKPNLKVKV